MTTVGASRFGAQGDLEVQAAREERRRKSRLEFDAIFALAGFEVVRVWELANHYWPDNPHYDEVRQPWWLFQTTLGLIEVGARKRVISIDWSSTPARGIVTNDDVTKNETLVHAWTVEKAIEYLRALRLLLEAYEAGDRDDRDE